MWASIRAVLAGLACAGLAFGVAWWLSARHTAAQDAHALLVADSLNTRAVDSVAALLHRASARADSFALAWHAADSAEQVALARPVKVDTLWRQDTTGPAVPIPVVAETEYNDLKRACSVAASTCSAALAQKDSAIDVARRELDAIKAHPVIVRDTVRLGSRFGIDATVGPSVSNDGHGHLWSVTLGVSYRLWPWR